MNLLDKVKYVHLRPANSDTDGGFSTSYVSMKGYNHATFLYNLGDTIGQTHAITMHQATTVAGGSVKTFSYTTCYIQSNAGAKHITNTFTKTTVSAATNNTGAYGYAVFAVEVDAADLDVSNNFDCIRMNVADPNTSYGNVVCILSDPRYIEGPTVTPISPTQD